MYYCQNCGQPLRAEAKFCHICGAAQSLEEYEDAPKKKAEPERKPAEKPTLPKVIPMPPVENLENKPLPPERKPEEKPVPPEHKPEEKPVPPEHKPEDKPVPPEHKPEDKPVPPEEDREALEKVFSMKCESVEIHCSFENGTGTLTIRFH